MLDRLALGGFRRFVNWYLLPRQMSSVYAVKTLPGWKVTAKVTANAWGYGDLLHESPP